MGGGGGGGPGVFVMHIQTHLTYLCFLDTAGKGLFVLNNFIFYSMCIAILPECMSVCTRGLWRPEQDIRYPGTRVIEDCELPGGG